MRMLAIALLTIVLTAASASAQAVRKTYTRPSVPPPEALERLNLQLDWQVYVPTDGRRDGLFDVQPANGQVFVQTRAGLVVAIDKDTGMLRWRAQVGTPYAAMLPLSFNSDSVFVVNTTTLYALDRATGQQRWKMPLGSIPRTTPLADDDRLHLVIGDRIVVYEFIKALAKGTASTKGERLPAPAAAGKGSAAAAPAAASSKGSLVVSELPEIPLILAFDYPLHGRLEQPPLITPRAVFAIDDAGRTYSLSTKHDRKEIFESLTLNAPPVTALGSYSDATTDTVYVATQDFVVRALDINNGQILWRFTSGTPILDKPVVAENEVFVTALGVGMYCLNRQDGRPVWPQPSRQAMGFLAANNKFVYAVDRSGRLLVLDRFRGTVLSGFDTHDFVVAVTNELTDRIYLGANNGLIISLHDRDYPTPLPLRKVQESLPKPKQPGKPSVPPAEKPKEKEGDKPAEKDADKKDADAPEKKG
jgi:outer membrane protein assembly factor BamB